MHSARSTSYRVSDDTSRRLETLVEKIEMAPGPLIDAKDFEERGASLDMRNLKDSLPESLSLDDLVGILRLALLTECATDSYAGAMRERAAMFDAGWLARFVDRVWVPDELTHHAPYKHMLMRIGFAEDELDSQIKQTQEKEFVHYGGDTPVHVTTFGMTQEYLTDQWHGLIASLLSHAAPDAAHMALAIKRRETMHMVWYRDMTALQVEAEPAYIAYMAEELVRFRMPGNSLIPDLQSKADTWLSLLGADMDRVVREMLRLLHQVLQTPSQLGRLLTQLATEKGIKFGPLSSRHVEAAVNRLGGPGYGLVGEAALQMAHLDYLFRAEPVSRNGTDPVHSRVAGTIRSLLRGWLAEEMARRIGKLAPGFASPGSAIDAPA